MQTAVRSFTVFVLGNPMRLCWRASLPCCFPDASHGQRDLIATSCGSAREGAGARPRGVRARRATGATLRSARAQPNRRALRAAGAPVARRFCASGLADAPRHPPRHRVRKRRCRLAASGLVAETWPPLSASFAPVQESVSSDVHMLETIDTTLLNLSHRMNSSAVVAIME